MNATQGRSSDRLAWVVAGAVLAAVVAVTLGASLLGLRTFSAVDILGTKAPWRASAPVVTQAQEPYAGDTVDAYLPKAKLLHDDVRHGRLPWWTTTSVGGEPLLAVPDSALLSPVSAPFWVLPTWLAPGFVKLLEGAAACAGMVLLLGRLGLARWCGLVAGTAYALSGFMVAWTGWPQTRTAAFIPLLFYAVERLVQERDARSTVVLAATVTALLLGGFPAVTGFALMAAGVHLVVRGVLPWAGARLLPGLGLRALGGIVLGIALAGVQLLPFLHRWHEIDFSYRDSTAGSHPPLAAAATLLMGDVFGLGTPGQPFHGPVNPVEIQAFAGVAVLLLALAAVTLVRLEGPAQVTARSYAALVAVVATVTWGGGPLLVLLQEHVPVFDNNPVGRIVSLLGFLLSALAGFGLHGLAGRSWQRRGVALFVGAGAVVAGLAALVLRSARHDYLTPAMGHRMRVLVLLTVIGVLAVAVARFAGPRAARVAVLLLPVLLVGQALPWVHRWWPQNDPALFYPRTAVHDLLAREIGHDRLATQGSVPVNGSSIAYGLRAIDGHTFVADRWRDLLAAASPSTFVTRTYTTLPVGAAVLAAPVLDRLGVRLVVSSPDQALYGEDVDPPAGSASTVLGSTPVALALPAAHLRGVAVRALEVRPSSRYRVLLRAEVRDAAGRVLASGTVDGVSDGGVRWIPFPDTQVPRGGRVLVSAERGSALLTADAHGLPALGLARVPAGDTLRVIGTGGATVWERTTALPRIRLARTARVIPDPLARVAALAGGQLPRDEVLLDTGPAQSGTAGAPPRALDVLQDDDGRIEVKATAGAEPYLVVADDLVGNWTATVNGRHVPLRQADHALAAVDLPPGPAHVVLVARVAGLRTGAVTSALAGLVALALLTLPGWFSRRRERAH